MHEGKGLFLNRYYIKYNLLKYLKMFYNDNLPATFKQNKKGIYVYMLGDTPSNSLYSAMGEDDYRRFKEYLQDIKNTI